MQRNLSFHIWVFTVLIVVSGLVALYSASYQNVRVSSAVFYDQFWMSVIGFAVMFVLSRIDYRKFYDVSYVFYAFCVLLLVMVLVAGRHALGATRWLNLGPISFQPSELAKLGLILVLARYFSDARPAVRFSLHNIRGVLARDLFVPLLLTIIMMLLIFKQPDLGTSFLFFGIFMAMLFVSQLEYRYILSFLGICLAAVPFAWGVLKPYQQDRLLVFLNPNIDPLGTGYTIIQSKIAVGSGKIFGKGWLSGTQNQLNFLPERHTDFIFSVIGEEWGIVGTLSLVFFYFMLVFTAVKVSEQVKDKFGTQVTIGITAILTLQVIINMGMVLGLFPVVGLALPLVSYGRSSFMVFMIMLGILLSISRRRTIF